MEESKLPQVSTPANGRPAIGQFFDLPYQQKMEKAVEIANALSRVVEEKKLYTVINHKKHINIEGWASLGTMVNVIPTEEYVRRLDDGTYEAKVRLVDFQGNTRGEGSAICGMDEPSWRTKPEFSRRSMAITRAAGKAFRVTLSWIPAMAGYSGTPAEEMDFVDLDSLRPEMIRTERLIAAAAEIKDAAVRQKALQFIETHKNNPARLDEAEKRIKEVLK